MLKGFPPILQQFASKTWINNYDLFSISTHEARWNPPRGEQILLHEALRKKADADVVKGLLSSSPSSLFQRNEDGNSPLHYAICHQATLDVLELLVKATVTARNSGEASCETAEQNNIGQTALHLAAIHNVSEDVFNLIFEYNPESIYTRDVTGKLPLHYAALHENSLVLVHGFLNAHNSFRHITHTVLPLKTQNAQVVEIKIENDFSGHDGKKKNPASMEDMYGRTPLHIAAQNSCVSVDIILAVLTAFPSAAARKDNYGLTPLHHAIMRRETTSCSNVAIRAMVRMHPRSASVCDYRGLYPLEMWLAKENAKKGKMIRNVSLHMQVDSRFTAEEFLAHNRLTEVWETLCSLISASALSESSVEGENSSINVENFYWEDETARIVRSSAALKYCPPDVMKLAARLYPHQLAEVDDGGNLPLHLAISRCDSRCDPLSSANESSNASTSENEEDWVFDKTKFLLDVYPDAGKVRNGSGYLPLHLLVGRCKKWNFVLQDMVNAYPEAVMTAVDDKKGLFPFMLASGANASVDMIYELFRFCPEMERYHSSTFEIKSLIA